MAAVRRSGTRDLSRTAVLALLGRRGPLSRADIARDLDLSPAAVTQIVRRLLAQGMAAELETIASNGGRPGQLVGLVGDAGRAVGVKVAADHLVIVDMRLDGEVLASDTRPFDALHHDALARLSAALTDHVTSTVAGPPLLGVGIGVAGIVDSPDNGNVNAAVLGWTDVPLGRYLKGTLGLPVVIENDVNALAVAELLYGRGRHVDNFAVVTIGRGVGLAIVADGSIYRGGRGGAGEFGHFPVEVGGPVCECGRQGCLEAVIGQAGLVRSARERGILGPRQQLARLIDLADRGNSSARALLHEAGNTLGRAVAGLTNVLDPDLIVILGEGTAQWRHWEAGFHAEYAQHILHTDPAAEVAVDPWDDTRWAQGAAALVLSAPFDLDGFGGDQTELVLARLHRAAPNAST